jgi:hypothetical protein
MLSETKHPSQVEWDSSPSAQNDVFLMQIWNLIFNWALIAVLVF